MKASSRLKLWVPGLIVGAMLCGASPAGAEVLPVDSFSEANAALSENWYIYPLVDTAPWEQTDSDPVTILGGEREITVTPIYASPPPATSVAVAAAVGIDLGICPEGALQLATQQSNSALIELVYDGAGSAGLGGLDFTGGGTNDQFVLTFDWIAAVGSLGATVTVTDTEGRQTSRTEFFSDVAARTEYPVLFADFSGDAGASFESVDSLEIKLNSDQTPQVDFALHSIELVPEPASWTLLVVALTALGLLRWTRRGRA
jgi:hypothetical protein